MSAATMNEMDRLRRERDGARAERDALADKLAESDHALMQLGRLKAEWQAEALEELLPSICDVADRAEVRSMYAELRRQAEEAP